MVIDFHVHVFPPRVKADRAAYLHRDAGFRTLYSGARERIAIAEDLIASMDRAGIDVSVIQGFGWADQDSCREHNEYLLEAAARYPGRLIPGCTVQPLAGAAAEAEVRRCAEAGAKGLGELRPEEQGYGLLDDWSALEPLSKVAREHRLFLLLHASDPVGHLYPGKGHMTPETLYRLVLAYPEWPIVLAHLGGGLPFYAAMPEVRKALANTYVDTAAWPLLYRPEVFPALVGLFGAERVLFASDYPVLDQSRVLERTRSLPLESESLRRILGENAARLLELADG